MCVELSCGVSPASRQTSNVSSLSSFSTLSQCSCWRRVSRLSNTIQTNKLQKRIRPELIISLPNCRKLMTPFRIQSNDTIGDRPTKNKSRQRRQEQHSRHSHNESNALRRLPTHKHLNLLDLGNQIHNHHQQPESIHHLHPVQEDWAKRMVAAPRRGLHQHHHQHHQRLPPVPGLQVLDAPKTYIEIPLPCLIAS